MSNDSQAAIADQRIKQAMKDEKMAAEARIRNLKDDIDEIIGCGDLPAVFPLPYFLGDRVGDSTKSVFAA